MTLQETITGISIKSIDQISEYKIEHKNGHAFHRITFNNGGVADISWGGADGEQFSCTLENVSQTYTQDPKVANGVIIILHEPEG